MRQSISAIIAAAATILSLNTKPADASYTIYAPNATVAGQSIADWTEGWWTWAATLPAMGNAFDTPTDNNLAHQNNNGPVFYLAGYFSGTGPVVHQLSVTAGQPLLVGLINAGPFQFSPVDEQFIINSFQASSLTATVDGTQVSNPFQYLQTTDFFSAGPIMPGTIGDSIFATPGFSGIPPNCQPTDLCPGLSTGYWLMLSLSPGVHEIDLSAQASFLVPPDLNGGTVGEVNFPALNDYIITAVAPEPASALLLLPGMIGLFAFAGRSART
jgi:hypothetical protein